MPGYATCHRERVKLVWVGIAAIVAGVGGAVLVGMSGPTVGRHGDPGISRGYVQAWLFAVAAAGILTAIAGLVAWRTGKPGAAVLWTGLSAVVTGCVGGQVVQGFLLPYTDDTVAIVFIVLATCGLLIGGGLLMLVPWAAGKLWRLLRHPEQLSWSTKATAPVRQR